MTDYLFTDPETQQEAYDRRGYLLGRIAKGNPVSMASVVWARVGTNFRPPNGWPIYAMVATFRGEPEIQGPFRNPQEAADYVNGSDVDSMIFALDPKHINEWGETDDKYVLVRIVKPTN